MRQHAKKSTRHWFSIYQLMERYLEERTSSSSTGALMHAVIIRDGSRSNWTFDAPKLNKTVIIFDSLNYNKMFHKCFFAIFSFFPWEEEEPLSLSSVSSSLQAFIESSTLGEFHTRLGMLLSFHCHLLMVPKQPGQGEQPHHHISKFSSTTSDKTKNYMRTWNF